MPILREVLIWRWNASHVIRLTRIKETSKWPVRILRCACQVSYCRSPVSLMRKFGRSFIVLKKNYYSIFYESYFCTITPVDLSFRVRTIHSNFSNYVLEIKFVNRFEDFWLVWSTTNDSWLPVHLLYFSNQIIPNLHTNRVKTNFFVKPACALHYSRVILGLSLGTCGRQKQSLIFSDSTIDYVTVSTGALAITNLQRPSRYNTYLL